ncbi:hypothetical protein K3888_13010 [Dietzia aurantiaca]|uniref:hypothetical protein n=1 Tax=Dietzia aurantiaca TaxID=983873 RepID=UPI001E371100|nr:hypothetical protein [Dietzia aurantiaca]MCD2263619.1 hypothetical protein [Dietzia aurantiaca]
MAGVAGVWVAKLVVVAMVATVGAAPAAAGDPPVPYSAPTAAPLDVVEDNPHGERGGGFASSLPTDSATLRPMLDRARASGVDPARYATLARQYWLAVGAEKAGIDLQHWVPERGLAANLENVDKVYVNYLRLANSRDDYFWTGMAGLAGMSFAAGFWDLEEVGQLLTVPAVHQLGTAVGGALHDLPWELAREMPEDVRLLATVGPTLTRADIDWYLHRLLVMQRHIFMDMIPAHEAYAAEGLPAVEELAAGGAYDEYVVDAWRMVDAGGPANLAEVLVRMASREQNQIIADQWDDTAAGRDDVGRVLTYITTVGGSPDIPGARSLGQFRPLTVQAEVDGRPMTAHTPLPAFNWADRGPRWEYIEQDLVPRYRELVQDRPAEAEQVLGVVFRERAEQNRILRRLPEFLTEMTSGWAVVAE